MVKYSDQVSASRSAHRPGSSGAVRVGRRGGQPVRARPQAAAAAHRQCDLRHEAPLAGTATRAGLAPAPGQRRMCARTRWNRRPSRGSARAAACGSATSRHRTVAGWSVVISTRLRERRREAEARPGRGQARDGRQRERGGAERHLQRRSVTAQGQRGAVGARARGLEQDVHQTPASGRQLHSGAVVGPDRELTRVSSRQCRIRHANRRAQGV